jgi:putative redox protein
MHYIVTGKALAAAQVERAIKLSKEKYCSATIMLAKTAEIIFDYEIREAGAEVKEA